MSRTVIAVPGIAGDRGFDVNVVVTAAAARAFATAGYRFAVRYVPRETARSNDLSVNEIQDLHDVGIAVMPVQHVESESSWIPTDDKGRRYGETAAQSAHTLGLASGTTVWLDLEGVAVGTPAESVIRYCNFWHDRVAAAGFQPGLYVGWHAMLSPDELYRRLKFTRYWGAYNLNADQCPAVCGLAMKQGAAKPGDVPSGIGYPIDTDTILADSFGRTPTLTAPANWASTLSSL